MSSLGARGGTVVTQADRVRLDVGLRRQVVLDAAMRVARRDGLLSLTWAKVLRECEVTTTLTTGKRSFESLVALRRAVAEAARLSGDASLTEQATRHGILN